MSTQVARRGSIPKAMAWMIGLSVALFWIPLLGSFIAGFVGFFHKRFIFLSQLFDFVRIFVNVKISQKCFAITCNIKATKITTEVKPIAKTTRAHKISD